LLHLFSFFLHAVLNSWLLHLLISTCYDAAVVSYLALTVQVSSKQQQGLNPRQVM
jgi:hypothetical protein